MDAVFRRQPLEFNLRTQRNAENHHNDHRETTVKNVNMPTSLFAYKGKSRQKPEAVLRNCARRTENA